MSQAFRADALTKLALKSLKCMSKKNSQRNILAVSVKKMSPPYPVLTTVVLAEEAYSLIVDNIFTKLMDTHRSNQQCITIILRLDVKTQDVLNTAVGI